MKTILKVDYVVLKVFNNNIILANNNGKEKILFEKGIGFGKKVGEIIKKGTEIDKIFTIENQFNVQNFNEIVSKNDEKFLALCEEIIYDISNKLGEDLSENIHIGLTEHISFAIKRLNNNEEIQNPFLIEIQTLYPQEFELAKEAAIKIKNSTGVLMPDGEVGFIALHIHSARNNGKLSNTIKYSYIGNKITEYVEKELNIVIDKTSLDYARFLTHMRFAIERIMKKSLIKNDLLNIIKESYPKSYLVAEKVAKILENELEVKVVEDEVAYIAMHIQRFRVSVENN
ncbi:transcriptional antiterminator, BglG family [Clostridium cavendishii DSM 21758]|uniref:Transcriptional antiterminator, BglG family n=1 Tax=Clostridium cavendishii DSM 21758 TaxID=1121302 RepID=A0A1M6VQW0_9CLOT|nr:PRD domain-containing protein [Clostridium cavendishii]SHK83725.1 transcriptional antiterminator, BglG family [Clostridium cavendishii DSM 21758]